MAEYNLVNFNDTLYLTDDGLVTGRPCRVEVSGLDALALPYAGNVTSAADGTPYAFVIAHHGQGAVLKLSPAVITTSVLASIKSVFQTAIAAEETINLKLTGGDLGNFDLECLPLFPRPIEFSGKFLEGNIYDVVLGLVVRSQN